MADHSTSPSPCDAGHMGNRNNVENERDEREALICTNDSTTLSAEGSDKNDIHRPPTGEKQSTGSTKEINSTSKGSDTNAIHRLPAGEKQSSEKTKEIDSTPKGQRVHVNMANLSFIERMAKSLSSGNVVVLTGVPGSGKTFLAQKTGMSACQNITGANLRPVDFKYLNEIDKDKSEDKKLFLILDEYIKSWFNKNITDVLLKKLENAITAGKGETSALVCVPATVLDNVKKFLKKSALKYKIYDLSVDGYTQEDWGAIFDSHMQSRKEWLRDKKYQQEDIYKYREAYIKCKAGDIGKATIPSLLFENAFYLKSASKLIKNPYDLMLQRITALSESNCKPDVGHFVVLVILMLHNGKVNIEDINKGKLTEICEVFKVENFSLSHDLEHEDVEQYGNIVSIRCRETVRVIFDVVWKKRKAIILKYCDDELFLERVTLHGVGKDDLLAINERFQSMISAGTPCVGEHNILVELRSKCSTFEK
ncbi:uncharacterized protein LOC130046552 [Ostrea edulis]|uniref:uncharacterized protein LOC130046552 n=1 Tax=Ostrea edulis TaxID=37623 RepID=UPI0024AFF6E7|nr:uncharacterized protein LOC130046552 [Ostrea edulis]